MDWATKMVDTILGLHQQLDNLYRDLTNNNELVQLCKWLPARRTSCHDLCAREDIRHQGDRRPACPPGLSGSGVGPSRQIISIPWYQVTLNVISQHEKYVIKEIVATWLADNMSAPVAEPAAISMVAEARGTHRARATRWWCIWWKQVSWVCYILLQLCHKNVWYSSKNQPWGCVEVEEAGLRTEWVLPVLNTQPSYLPFTLQYFLSILGS